MSVSDATSTLTALGLTVSGVQGSPDQKVTGASPAVGTEVKPGSAGHPHHQVAGRPPALMRRARTRIGVAGM